MYGLVQYEFLRRRHEQIRREVAMERPTTMAREERQSRPYVVRDLSWELARYLDTDDFSESASATSNSVGEHRGRTPEERLAG